MQVRNLNVFFSIKEMHSVINRRFSLLTICLIIFVNLFGCINCVMAKGDYPKSRVERQMDEMGSLLEGEGLVFRPQKTRSEATKATIGNVNKYLYQAALEVLDFAPMASVDSNSGVIITEWYHPKGQKDTQFKINVFIKDTIISPESIEVKAYERNRVRGRWSKDYKDSAISSILEDKIIRRARTLYQEEK